MLNFNYFCLFILHFLHSFTHLYCYLIWLPPLSLAGFTQLRSITSLAFPDVDISLTEPSRPHSCLAQRIQWSLLLKGFNGASCSKDSMEPLAQTHMQFKNLLELNFPIISNFLYLVNNRKHLIRKIRKN